MLALLLNESNSYVSDHEPRHEQVSHGQIFAWFFKIVLSAIVCMCACLSVCLPTDNARGQPLREIAHKIYKSQDLEIYETIIAHLVSVVQTASREVKNTVNLRIY